MEKGKIVEDGNHDTLLVSHPNGVYAKLVKTQEAAEAGQEADNPANAGQGLLPSINSAPSQPVQVNVNLKQNKVQDVQNNFD